jgi:predicted nucleic acid-binding protein
VTRILLDTNAYAAFKRGHPDAGAVIQRADGIALTPVVLGEPLGGFAAGAKERQNRAELSAFLSSPRVWVAPLDGVTAEHYATIYAALRAAGTPPDQRPVDRPPLRSSTTCGCLRLTPTSGPSPDWWSARPWPN